MRLAVLQAPPSVCREMKCLLFAAAVVVAAFAVCELDRPALLVNRLLWAASNLALIPLIRKGPRPGRVFGLAALILNFGYFFVFVMLTGGVSSPYAPWTFTLPLLISPFVMGNLPLTLLASGATVAFWVWVESAAGIPSKTAWQVVATGGAMFGMSWLLGQFVSRTATAEATVERQRAERLREGQRQMLAERLATIGRLAAGVAHEVNNPLGYVKANLHFIDSELRAGGRCEAPDVSEALADSLQGVARIQQIVKDLRLLARDAPQGGGVCRVEEVLEAALRIASMRLSRGFSFAREIETPDLVVKADAGRLEQVLLNLLINAADALEEKPAPDGGRITVRVHASGSRVRIEVQDNGPGILPENLERIFDPFFTTKPVGKGTGLGLSLAREYITRAGGRLTATSAPRRGALFVIDLPMAGEGAQVLELTPVHGTARAARRPG